MRRRTRSTVVTPAPRLPTPRVDELKSPPHLALNVLAALIGSAFAQFALGGELPVPCGACGANGPTAWVSSGTASAVSSGNLFTVNQASARAILNWQSFNISADGKVEFRQPDANAVALNRIFQGDPVRILGTLQANGSVYLINQNGILFGSSARVNVGGLVASTLDVTPDALDNILKAAANSSPAFRSFVDGAGNNASGDVQVQRGAELTADAGQMLLLGMNVTNEGLLRAPGGQIVLAAGDSVYVAPSFDPNLRGLLVDVGHGGNVTNAVSGDIGADRGNATLVGLLVNQQGRVSASTSVRENGSIRLLARDNATIGGNGVPVASHGGELRLGAGSMTSIALEQHDDDTAVDATAQLRSLVELEGRTISLESHSLVAAPSGVVQATARATPVDVSAFPADPGDGRIAMAADARIDVSGARIDRPVADNVIKVELRGSQLEDSPVQRDGPLRGKTVFVDIRRSGTRADGTTWQGSPIGDLAGDIGTIQRTAEERNLNGGEIRLAATGAVLLQSGSVLDVSGGAISYQGGIVDTSQVLGADGRVYDIAEADPNRPYVGFVNAYTRDHAKWGVTESFATFLPGPGTRYEPGYVEGKDSGSVTIASPRVALDGDIRGQAAAGIRQRRVPTPVPAGALYRSFDQLPLYGRLTLGVANSSGTGGYVTPDVEIAEGRVLQGLPGSSNGSFNPLLDPLPADLATVRIRPGLFGPDGLGGLSIYANGIVDLPANTSLILPAAGQLAVTAGAIDVEGTVAAQGGSVSLSALPTIAIRPGGGGATAPGVTLGSAAFIDVAGRWVNDASAPLAPTEHGVIAIDGGSVTLAARLGASLDLRAGSVIDVSGAAHRLANGSITAGVGGSVAIGAESILNQPVSVNLGTQLRAYALARGGRLSLTLNALCVADSDCGDDSVGKTWIDLPRYAADGFSSFSFTSNLGGVEVLPGTFLQPRQVNYLWKGDPSQAPSGTPLPAMADLGVLPDELRLPVALSFTVSPQLTGSIDASNFDSIGALRIGAGATVDVGVGGSLSLKSSTSVFVDGTLNAPAGDIHVTVTRDLPLQSFLPSQGLFLGAGARLTANGAVRALRDDFGFLRGSVLDGGTIELSAQRGYLSTAPGSVLDVSGVAADLVLGQVPVGTGAHSQTVASSGGAIGISAAEALILNGALVAQPGAGPVAGGGTLQVTLDGNLHGQEPFGISQPVFPFDARELRIANGTSSVVIGSGSELPESFYGKGLVSAERLMDGGFRSIGLSATNLFDSLGPQGSNVPVSTGSIVFDGSMALHTAASLRLNAPRIASAAGSAVSLAASYVGLGYDDIIQNAQAGGFASAGTSSLRVSGDLIDIIGTLGVDGFATATFGSSGDIRFRGVQSSSPGAPAPIGGLLHAAGSVDFTAQQIYATTLTDFTVLLDGSERNVLSIHSSPGGAQAPLSAGSRLTLTADEILQAGSVLAPFGTIALNAERVDLAPGSVTSTSGAGSLIPFGTLQVGTDWTYQLPRGQTTVYTKLGPPAQRISLDAADLVVDNGALLDLRGGGDLLGYEFVPGVTGTKDVLANGFSAGQFAIVPKLGAKFAPIDPSANVGFGFNPGDSVYLQGYGDLAAGEYAILPARYALLPGAYLVRPVSGYTDIRPDESVRQLDGSVVVAGYRTVAGTSLRDPRTSGFAVVAADQLRATARYDLSTADDFFRGLADTDATVLPRLPRDSGQLQLITTASLDLAGQLHASAAVGGRGALVDISASRLLISGDAATTDPTAVLIQASQLNSLGAESVLLGGLRHQTSGGIEIETRASQVTLGASAALQAPTLMLVARDELKIEAGASLRASGSGVNGAESLLVSGPGAVVQVSTAAQPELVRSNPAGSGGSLSIAAGALIASRGSALLEATGNVDAHPDYHVSGGSLAFSVSQLAIGDAPASYQGLALSATELSSLGLADLSLTSRAGIEFFGDTTLDVRGRLALQASGLTTSTDARATIRAQKIVLTGAAGGTLAATSGNGAVALAAEDLMFGGGDLATVGFGAVSLAAGHELRASLTGGLHSAGTVTIEAPVITTDSGVDFGVTASLAIQLIGAGNTGVADRASAGLGGSLSFQGERVSVATTLLAPAGLVSLTATGADPSSIALQPGALIDVGGRGMLFDGQLASADGGLLRMTSAQGGIAVSAGATIDISRGDGAGKAGKLDARALVGRIGFVGTLLAQGNSAGGQVAFDGYAIPDLGTINRLLNSAGATGSRVFHQRGPGNLVVDAAPESAVRATNIAIEADGGSVMVFGNVDASGRTQGAIKLTARDDVDVYGFLTADASSNGVDGGRVDLWSDQGGIYLRPGGGVSVAGGAGGNDGVIGIRARRDALLTATDADPDNDRIQLRGSVSGERELLIEGYQRYNVANNTIVAGNAGATTTNPLFADATQFMQSADALRLALGVAGGAIHVLPGIEIQSSQALTLAADWNLASWRFGDEPGVLTLRAAGDLNINRSLSDGFAAVSGAGAFAIPNVPSRSWSYRLVAGADLGASDVLAVVSGSATGSVRVAGGTLSTTSRAPVPIMIRTGTGSIDIAAARDLVLTNRASVIYTAGASSGSGISLPLLGSALANYPVDGGDIRIGVGGDIRGAPTNQLVTGWLWRAGQGELEDAPSATGWNVNFERFEQGVGALAGGSVSIHADGNIRDLSASIPTIGRQIGGVEIADSVVEQTGGGHLRVDSGGDITGGVYFVGRGDASLRSYGRVGVNTTPGAASALAPTLALGDTQFEVAARRDLTLETVLNPFLVPQASAQTGGASAISFFSTYTDRSALKASSTSGDINFINTPTRVGGLGGVITSSVVIGRGTGGFFLYPGTVRATALAGDFVLGGKLALWPSPSGNLDIFANGNVDLARGVSVADQDPSTLFNVADPRSTLTALVPALSSPLGGTAHVPIHSAAFRPDGTNDPDPLRIVATGDIAGANLAFLAKPVRLIAGGNIVDLFANIQNISDDSVSLISAHGDIRYTTPRDVQFGTILASSVGVRVDGPGLLTVQAGGNIDLGTSLGVTSAGNFVNPALPTGGADVSLLAGATFSSTQLDLFEKRYLVDDPDYDGLLANFLSRHGSAALQTKSAQIVALRALSADLRYELARSVLLAEVRAGGRAAANAGPQHGDYSRAFDAIEELFPGSTQSDAQGPSAGISLFFSRIYTLDGGSIGLVAPHGDVNVGLATPPAAFGVSKRASDLGIVVQRTGNIDSLSYSDFQVNESRVFVAGGGDILVWSTQGDIDAGRGAKTAIAAPPPTITFDSQGNVQTVFPAVLTGSGIQALSTIEGVRAGAVDLFAPRGVVNAGDAGIVAGNLTIGATAVLGADNISVSGVSVGVPVDTGGFAAGLTGASSVGAGATNAADDTVAQSRQEQTSSTPLADQALGFLDVFVTGFGEPCDSAKEDCRNNNR